MRQVLFTPLSALPDDGVAYNTSFTFRVCVTKANEDGSRVCDAYGETQARSLYTLVPSLYAIPSARRASILGRAHLDRARAAARSHPAAAYLTRPVAGGGSRARRRRGANPARRARGAARRGDSTRFDSFTHSTKMLDKVLQAVVSAGVAVATIKYAGAVGGGANVGVIAENKSVVRKLYREVWNQTDKLKAKTAASKFVSDDHFLIDPSDPSPSPGTDAYMQSVIRLRDAMPNYVIVVDDLIAQGIKVVCLLYTSPSPRD